MPLATMFKITKRLYEQRKIMEFRVYRALVVIIIFVALTVRDGALAAIKLLISVAIALLRHPLIYAIV